MFDIENLEQISFERSKFWANLLNKFEERDDGEDDCLKDFCSDEADEEDDAVMNSSNEAEEADVFDDEDIINGTLLAGSNELPTILMHGGNTADIQTLLNCEEVSVGNAELQDILNETVPLLQEHKRKWEEAGIEQILNTFDHQKIEEKVGGWLRRNHSGISTLSISPTVTASTRRYNPKIAPFRHNVCFATNTKKITHVTATAEHHVDETDTDTSLHSMDTARYIRSSRQQRHGSGNSGVFGKRLGTSASTATMTIKTFRLVEKKREALRKKYACLDSGEDGDMINYRRNAHAPPYHRYSQQQQQKNQQVDVVNKNVVSREPAVVASEERRCNHRNQLKTRRKHLRKYRHASNSSTSSSDSSSSLSFSSINGADKYNETLLKKGLRRYKVVKHRRRRVSLKRICYRTVCCGRAYRHSLSSSSSHSYVDTEHGRKVQKVKGLQSAIMDEGSDMRPYKRESDCRCCNDNKLCRETRHLADTSTEDWMVENCESPMKKQNLALPSCHRHQLQNKKSKVSALVKYYEQNKQNTNNRQILAHPPKKVEISANVNETTECKTDKIRKKENVPKPTATINTKSCRSLQKCVDNEGSKNSLSSCSSKSKATKSSNISKKTKPSLRKTEKINCDDDVKEETDPEETFAKELEKAIELSKKTYEKEIEKSKQNQNISANLKEITNRKRNEESISTPKEISPAKVTKHNEESIKALMENDELSLSSNCETIEASIRKFLIKPQPRSAKLRKLASISAKQIHQFNADDTFFQFPKNIYNSTALANDTAMPRQFFNDKTTAKSSTTTMSSARKSAAVIAANINGSISSFSSLKSVRSPITTENNYNDCTVVSSTTGIDPQQQPQSHPPKGILLYKPTDKSLVAVQSLDNGFIHIKQEHLSTVIGEKHARKFFKYYVGRRRFNSNSTIYYRPPKQQTSTPLNPDDSTDSDEDALESVCKYGDLYESMNMG